MEIRIRFENYAVTPSHPISILLDLEEKEEEEKTIPFHFHYISQQKRNSLDGPIQHLIRTLVSEKWAIDFLSVVVYLSVREKIVPIISKRRE